MNLLRIVTKNGEQARITWHDGCGHEVTWNVRPDATFDDRSQVVHWVKSLWPSMTFDEIQEMVRKAYETG